MFPALHRVLPVKKKCRGRGSFANVMMSSDSDAHFETLPETEDGAAESKADEDKKAKGDPAAGPRAVLYGIPTGVSDTAVKTAIEDFGVEVLFLILAVRGAFDAVRVQWCTCRWPDSVG